MRPYHELPGDRLQLDNNLCKKEELGKKKKKLKSTMVSSRLNKSTRSGLLGKKPLDVVMIDVKNADTGNKNCQSE